MRNETLPTGFVISLTNFSVFPVEKKDQIGDNGNRVCELISEQSAGVLEIGSCTAYPLLNWKLSVRWLRAAAFSPPAIVKYVTNAGYTLALERMTSMLQTTANRQLDILQRLDNLVQRYGKHSSTLIPMLQEIQNAYRYLPEDLLTHVATALDLSPATVYGVATFYAQFSLEPKGKYVIQVCDGTACHVRGSMPVYEAICKKVRLVDGKATTEDGMFTVETVSCVGACAAAPVVTINGEVYGKVTPDAIHVILDTLESRGDTADA